MKNKETVNSNVQAPIAPKQKPKSLRPMRSMVALRSLKPKTTVATMNLKPEIQMERN